MSDAIAARLSSKLLQGWCMMDISCEVCNTPLMRDKQKQDYCCGCEKFTNLKVEKLARENREEKKKTEENKEELKSQASKILQEKIENCAEKLLDRIGVDSSLEDCAKVTENLVRLSNAFVNFGFK